MKQKSDIIGTILNVLLFLVIIAAILRLLGIIEAPPPFFLFGR